MSNQLHYIPFTLLLFVACTFRTDQSHPIENSNTPQLSYGDLAGFVSKYQKNLDYYDEIIVIPGLGCVGCKEKVELYFLKNKDQPQILFIFTGIYDIKLLHRSDVGKYLDQSNVILDLDNFLRTKGVSTVYPAVLTINQNGFVYVSQFEDD